MTKITSQTFSSSKGLGIFDGSNEISLYYKYCQKDNTEFQILTSSDGLSLINQQRGIIIDRQQQPLPLDQLETCHVAQLGNLYALTYTETTAPLSIALSKDAIHWTKVISIPSIHERAMIIPNYYEQKRFILMYGEHDIKMATSVDLLEWQIKSEPLIKAKEDYWGTLSYSIGTIIPMEAGLAFLYIARGIGGSHWSIHGMMLDKQNPEQILWQADTIWEHTGGWEGKKVTPIGLAYHDKQLISYWDFAEEGVFALIHAAFNGIMNKKANFSHLALDRFGDNPVIKPSEKNFWESKATFNAAAIYEQGKIHLVYRAIGDSDTSVLGYAGSEDGYHFTDRLDEPIYIPTQTFEMPAGGTPWSAPSVSSSAIHDSPYASGGGGYGGCEDPRITRIDDRYYMTYVAYDGANPPRVALTSISTDDFHHKNWNWNTPVLISPPGVVDKNCVIFPEKINGKYAIMHRIFPNILIDYVDSLDFDGTTYLKGQFRIKPSRTLWDSRKVGAGPPPLKTKYGWLLIYHAVGEQDSGRYKVGAMLLDLNDPTKVLARTIIPILAPDHPHDNEGYKAGVVYPCGAIIKDDMLFVYYGGADTVVCGAATHLDHFMEELLLTGSSRLQSVYPQQAATLYAHF